MHKIHPPHAYYTRASCIKYTRLMHACNTRIKYSCCMQYTHPMQTTHAAGILYTRLIHTTLAPQVCRRLSSEMPMFMPRVDKVASPTCHVQRRQGSDTNENYVDNPGDLEQTRNWVLCPTPREARYLGKIVEPSAGSKGEYIVSYGQHRRQVLTPRPYSLCTLTPPLLTPPSPSHSHHALTPFALSTSSPGGAEERPHACAEQPRLHPGASCCDQALQPGAKVGRGFPRVSRGPREVQLLV